MCRSTVRALIERVRAIPSLLEATPPGTQGSLAPALAHERRVGDGGHGDGTRERRKAYAVASARLWAPIFV